MRSTHPYPFIAYRNNQGSEEPSLLRFTLFVNRNPSIHC